MELADNNNSGRITPIIEGQQPNVLNSEDEISNLDNQLNIKANEQIDNLNKKKAFFIELQNQLNIMQKFLQYRSNIIDQGLVKTAFSGLLFPPEMNDIIKIKLKDDIEKEKIIAILERANSSISKSNQEGERNKKEQLINYKITKNNELKINVHDIYRLCHFALLNKDTGAGFFLLVKTNEEIKKHDEKQQKKEQILNWITFGISIASTVATIVIEILVTLKVLALPMLTLPFSLPIIGASLPIMVVVTAFVSTLPLIAKIITKIVAQSFRQEFGKDAKMDCLLNSKTIEKVKGLQQEIEEVISQKAKKGVSVELKEQVQQNALTNELLLNDNNVNNIDNNSGQNSINNVSDNVGNINYDNNMSNNIQNNNSNSEQQLFLNQNNNNNQILQNNNEMPYNNINNVNDDNNINNVNNYDAGYNGLPNNQHFNYYNYNNNQPNNTQPLYNSQSQNIQLQQNDNNIGIK